jgi:hypothetical protein
VVGTKETLVTNGSALPPKRGHRPKRRVWLFTLIVVAGIASVQEAAFRWMFPLPEVEGFNRLTYTPFYLAGMEAERIRHKGLCNVKVRWECAPDGFAFDHTLNLYGFRGPDFSKAPPTDRPRVFFIGDSFVEGCGAADDDTLPQQFVRAMHAKSHLVEALNLGINGTGLDHYSLVLRDAVPLLKPALVFVVLSANDLPAPKPPSDAFREPREFPETGRCYPRLSQVLYRLYDGQCVPRRFYAGPYGFLEPVPSRANRLSTISPPEGVDPDVLRAALAGKLNSWLLGSPAYYEEILRNDFSAESWTRAYLDGMRRLCRKHKTLLVLAYVPYHAAINPEYIPAQNRLGGKPLTSLSGPEYRRPQQHLAQTTKRLQLTLLDTTGEFMYAEKNRGRMFWAIDGHCNAAGYGLIAETCARFMHDGALPRPAPPALEPKAEQSP